MTHVFLALNIWRMLLKFAALMFALRGHLGTGFALFMTAELLDELHEYLFTRADSEE